MASHMRSTGTPGGSAEKPATFFRDAAEFGRWLAAHHDTETELWMELRKKHVPDRGLEWADAVREALCWGWIDSRAERIDHDLMRQRWTPRRPGSIWSNVNITAVNELIAAGRMQPSGLAAWEARREDRSGVYSFEGDGVEFTSEFAAALAADPAASAFWEVATPSYRRHVTHWVMTAKQQATREKRMTQLLTDCAHGRLIPTQRYGTPPRWVERAAESARAAQRAL
ncbi:MAG: YdeI/OmpD-associated family protein [Dermatophilaceae bacterium]